MAQALAARICTRHPHLAMLSVLVIAAACASAASPQPSWESYGLTPELVATVLKQAPFEDTSLVPPGLDGECSECLRREAWSLTGQGREEEAIEKWACVIRSNPTGLEAQKALFDISVWLMQSTGDTNEAWQLYRAAVSSRPGDEDVWLSARLWQAELCFFAQGLDAGQGVAALESLAAECAGTENEGRVWIRLSTYWFERGDMGLADELHRRAVTTHWSATYVPWACLRYGEKLVRQAALRSQGGLLEDPEWRRGVQELQRVDEWCRQHGSVPLLKEALYVLAAAHVDAREWGQALAWFTRLAEEDPAGEWGAVAQLEAARCAALNADADLARALCGDVVRRTTGASWLKPRQERVFHWEIERTLSLCAPS